MFPLQDFLDGVGDRGNRRLDVLQRGLAVLDSINTCEMAPRTPRKLGSAARVARNGSALMSWAVSLRTSATDRNRIPSRAKNGPPSGRLTVWMRSFRVSSAFARAEAASSAPSAVFASTTATIKSVRCGKSAFSLISCRRQGSELDRSLLEIRRDGEVANGISGGEGGADEEKRDDEPRVAGRDARGSDDRLGNHGTMGCRHGRGGAHRSRQVNRNRVRPQHGGRLPNECGP